MHVYEYLAVDPAGEGSARTIAPATRHTGGGPGGVVRLQNENAGDPDDDPRTSQDALWRELADLSHREGLEVPDGPDDENEPDGYGFGV
jgi:hypothetical protein